MPTASRTSATTSGRQRHSTSWLGRCLTARFRKRTRTRCHSSARDAGTVEPFVAATHSASSGTRTSTAAATDCPPARAPTGEEFWLTIDRQFEDAWQGGSMPPESLYERNVSCAHECSRGGESGDRAPLPPEPSPRSSTRELQLPDCP